MFDPEVLQILGLNLLAQKSPNFGENLGNAGLATLQYRRQQEEDKYRKEEREFLKQQRAYQLAELQRGAQWQADISAGYRPAAPGIPDDQAPSGYDTSKGPQEESWDFGAATRTDPVRTAQFRASLLKEDPYIKLDEGQKLFARSKTPGAPLREVGSGGDKKPTAVKELEYALESYGIQKGTPAYQAAMQNFLLKTSGGLDVFKATLDAVRTGVEVAKGNDEGVRGMPGMPPPLPSYRIGGAPIPIPTQPAPSVAPPGLPPAPQNGQLPPQANLSPKQQRELSFDQAKSQMKPIAAAPTILSRLDEAEKILTDPNTTGSYVGRAVDMLGRVVSKPTKGDENSAKLETIAGALLVAMPRMEGPQSDADVRNYKAAAGDLADATSPPRVRLAALQQLREIYQKYAGNPPAVPQSASGRVINFSDLPLGR